MMFASKGRKALEANCVAVLQGFQVAVRDDTGELRDRDAAIMLIGWLHYSIAVLVQSARLRVSEIPSVLKAGALAVRTAAQNHGLGSSFIEVAQARVFEAMRQANGDQSWPFLYYELARSDGLTISEAAFAGALLREISAVAQVR